MALFSQNREPQTSGMHDSFLLCALFEISNISTHVVATLTPILAPLPLTFSNSLKAGFPNFPLTYLHTVVFKKTLRCIGVRAGALGLKKQQQQSNSTMILIGTPGWKQRL